jgi:Mn-dependent DtxR family transcriptional regulator
MGWPANLTVIGARYVEVVYLLAKQETDVTTTSVARQLSNTAAAALEGLSRLATDGRVMRRAPRGAWELTEAGRRDALALRHRRQVIAQFLEHVAGLPRDESVAEAERLSPVVSGRLARRMLDKCWTRDNHASTQTDPVR